MNGIKDFIAVASKQLGEPEDQTRQATGALLTTLQSKVADGDFQQLLGALPGASDLMAKTESPTVPATPAASPAPAAPGMGGVLGGAMSGMASKLGGAGAVGGALGLVGMIQKTGFAPAKVGGLIKKFMELVKGSAGEGLAKKLFTQIPELATLSA